MNATMSLEQLRHYPVMLNQIISIISPQHGGTFIDCTFGGGGYSKAILSFPKTKVIALDRDESVKQYADLLGKTFPNRFNFFREKFSNLEKILKPDTNPKAIIFDLGLSSFQIDNAKRGFSFKKKGPLNMKMGINKFSAYEAINKLENNQLIHILKILGEERDAKKIVKKIDIYRKKNFINFTDELSDIIRSVKKNYKKFKIDPATKTFQAIRIFVNQELSELIFGLIAATKLLKKGDILIVVSFHSLEDKIVKDFFNIHSNSKNPSRYLPIQNKKNKLFDIYSKKPMIPDKDELTKNIRSRSAKLRYAIRTSENFFYPEEFKKKYSHYLNLNEINL